MLVDEYGEGSDGHDYAHMYCMYLTACGVQAEENRVPCIQQWWISSAPLEVCSRRPFLVGLGAWGQDMNGMFVPIIKGQRRAFTEEEIPLFHTAL